MPIALTDARLPAQVRALAQRFGTQANKAIEWWLMSHEGGVTGGAVV